MKTAFVMVKSCLCYYKAFSYKMDDDNTSLYSGRDDNEFEAKSGRKSS